AEGHVGDPRHRRQHHGRVDHVGPDGQRATHQSRLAGRERRIEGMGTQVSLFAGALVLLTAGIVGLVRRTFTPAKAVAVLGGALVVTGLAFLGTRFPSTVYAVGIVVPVTLAGVLMAVGIVRAPERRIR